MIVVMPCTCSFEVMRHSWGTSTKISILLMAENFRPEVFNQNSYCIMVFFQKYSSRDILPENIIMMDFTRIFGMVGDVFGQNLEFFLLLDLTRKKSKNL